MVTSYDKPVSEASPINVPQDKLNWSSIRVSEVKIHDYRLEASVFEIEGRHAHEVVKRSKWEVVNICGDSGLSNAYYPPRFKRLWVDKSSCPIYQPSQITELHPKPSGYLSEKSSVDISTLRVKKRQLLLTRSGTIGKCCVVSDTLDGLIFSDDLIRITCKEDIDIGYLYAFLRSKIGQTLLSTNNYGAVISHIEPEHLNNVPIPNPHRMIKHKINELIMESFALRDKSNLLLDEAESLLIQELQLPNISEFTLDYYAHNSKIYNCSVKLSTLQNRLEASYHHPLVNAVISHLNKHALEVTTLGDKRISKQIILPGWFKRVYVGEEQGAVFFGGKQIYELDPTNKKYLSLKHHKDRIENELLLKENMIAITCSGTIGKTGLVPKHWDGWTMNQHVIRVVPSSNDTAGYIYVFLNSPYGRCLVERFTYGSVVDEIDNSHVSQVQIPLLQAVTIKRINTLALEANELRYKSYVLEQQALTLINREVLKTELDAE